MEVIEGMEIEIRTAGSTRKLENRDDEGEFSGCFGETGGNLVSGGQAVKTGGSTRHAVLKIKLTSSLLLALSDPRRRLAIKSSQAADSVTETAAAASIERFICQYREKNGCVSGVP